MRDSRCRGRLSGDLSVTDLLACDLLTSDPLPSDFCRSALFQRALFGRGTAQRRSSNRALSPASGLLATAGRHIAPADAKSARLASDATPSNERAGRAIFYSSAYRLPSGLPM